MLAANMEEVPKSDAVVAPKLTNLLDHDTVTKPSKLKRKAG